MSDNFEHWLPLLHLGVAHLPHYGEGPAVYAFRDARTRDILKYGSTDKLRRRILGNFIGGVGGGRPQSTTQFVHRELFEGGWIGHVELSWLETKDKAEAERQEKEFRAYYKKSHGRRPLWDRQD